MAESATEDVTPEWFMDRDFFLPTTCSVCDAEIAERLNQGDLLCATAEGEPVCRTHTEAIAYVLTGIYSFGGGNPSPTGKSFRIEDAVEVEG